MKFLKKCFAVMLIGGLGGIFQAPCAEAKEPRISVVTTTRALAELVREITGDQADIYSVSSGRQNIHFVSPTPKDVLKLKKAQVFVHQGLDAEPWREPLVHASGNPKFLGQGEGSFDASEGIRLLEIPEHHSRIEGDIHIHGNPHYLMDSENARIVLKTMAGKFSEKFPEKAGEFQTRAQDADQRFEQKITEWRVLMRPFQGQKVITYHRSWTYLLEAFGLEAAGTLEPKPGIAPSPKYLKELLETMRAQEVKVIILETYHERKTADQLAKKTGGRVVVLHQEPGNEEAYLQMMDQNIKALAGALGKAGGT